MLSQRDIDGVREINDLALQCQDFHAFERDMLPRFAEIIGAETSVFIRIDPEARRPIAHNAAGCGIGMPALADYCDYFHVHDPIYSTLLRRLDSGLTGLVSCHNTHDREAYFHGRFYHEFLAPQSIHHLIEFVTYDRAGRPTSVLGFHRPKTGVFFSAKDLVKGDLALSGLSLMLEQIAATHPIDNYGLTPRQAEITRLLRRGLTNAQIASQLGIAVRTVQNHLRLIYERVNVHNRTALVHKLYS
jgi:DNA-binding CsgD family transcriptional regulator